MVSLASSLSPPPPPRNEGLSIPASIKDRVSASTQVYTGLSQGVVQEADFGSATGTFLGRYGFLWNTTTRWRPG